VATKRTTMLLDTELMDEAAEILGTEKATDTVRASLMQTVRREHLRNLAAWEMPDTAEAELARQREWRAFDD
jgi:Arc/MetJ family transcription regulator